jgi:hypothetical protein
VNEQLPPPTDVETAAHRVLAAIGTPLHWRATVAALEGEGIRDVDADGISPGCPDVFALGKRVHERCLELPPVDRRPRRRKAAQRPGWQRLGRRYGRGIAYSLPMLAQGAVLIALHVSLWGSGALTPVEQTAIGFALVLTLVLFAPATHAMIRRLHYYRHQSDRRAMRRTALNWMGFACLAGPALAAMAAATFALTAGFGPGALAFCTYCALQPAMWVANSVLFAIRRSSLAAVALMAATLPIWWALRMGLPALAVHAAGLALADALLLGTALVALHRLTRRADAARRPLPRMLMPMAVGGYAAWGLIYFLLIFTDRLVAWTSNGGLAFQPHYEAALQIALVPLVLVLPMLEHVLVRFGELLETAARNTDPDDAGETRRDAVRAMRRLVLGALGVYATLAATTFVVATRWGSELPLGAGRMVAAGHAHTALVVALVAYGCVIAALGVASAYQLLQRPWPMVAIGAAAVLVDLAIGLIARRAGAPENACIGLLAGSVVFAGGMFLAWSRHQRRLDYLWFAAG